jgi:hypothetical protein
MRAYRDVYSSLKGQLKNEVGNMKFHSKEFLYKLISTYNGTQFVHNIPPEYLDEEEFLRTMIDIDPSLFQLASDRLKGDYHFVLSIVAKYPFLLQFASPELQNQAVLVLLTLPRSSAEASPTEEFDGPDFSL